jgi:hypothetical protein
MYHAIITSESLTNPVVLNTFKTKKVIIESVPLSEVKYWHIFVIEIDDKEVEKRAEELSMVMNQGWFQILWNDSTVYVILQNKVFKLKREKNWSSPEYEDMRQYAMQRGIAEEYLDFNQNFPEYEKIVDSL